MVSSALLREFRPRTNKWAGIYKPKKSIGSGSANPVGQVIEPATEIKINTGLWFSQFIPDNFHILFLRLIDAHSPSRRSTSDCLLRKSQEWGMWVCLTHLYRQATSAALKCSRSPCDWGQPTCARSGAASLLPRCTSWNLYTLQVHQVAKFAQNWSNWT